MCQNRWNPFASNMDISLWQVPYINQSTVPGTIIKYMARETSVVDLYHHTIDLAHKGRHGSHIVCLLKHGSNRCN